MSQLFLKFPKPHIFNFKLFSKATDLTNYKNLISTVNCFLNTPKLNSQFNFKVGLLTNSEIKASFNLFTSIIVDS